MGSSPVALDGREDLVVRSDAGWQISPSAGETKPRTEREEFLMESVERIKTCQKEKLESKKKNY